MIVFEPNLEQKLLIEAGAGTGKTWTIAGLYVRLVIEKNYPVQKILVVTFTNAATEELRERLRGKLVEARTAIENGVSDDLFEQELLNYCSDPASAIQSLTLAIRSFDEAAVYTIHGFCQKLLRDTALESGVGFDSELIADESDLIQQIVDDYWRKLSYQCSDELLAVLTKESLTPESLAQDIKTWIGKPWLEITAVEATDCNNCVAELLQSKRESANLFQEQQEEIVDLFKAAVGHSLHGNTYRKNTFWDSFSELASFLENDEILSLPAKANLFTVEILQKGTKNNFDTPEHPFFELWQSFYDQHLEFLHWIKQHHTNIRIDLLQYVRKQLEIRKAADSLLAYDDLLLLLNKALQREGSAALATTIRKQFPVALIDEFQDTDPIQYNIFNTLYPGKSQPLIFVGDPKQAIYSFRGADIHTYLQAKTDVDSILSLDENFRSSENLITAVNSLFSHNKNPFREAEISYPPVAAGRGEEQQQAAPECLGALRIWNNFESEKPLPKNALNTQIVDAVADEIATLLNNASDADHQVSGRNLQGGDIAILVRKNKQGEWIKQALNKRNIGCVQQMNDNVLTSSEALEIAILMHALLTTARDNDYRAALATFILGQTAQDIANLEDNAEHWEEWIDKFYHWRLIWQEQGFIVMIRSLLIEQQCYSRILKYPNGERSLTNILHVCELIHQEASRRLLSPESLLLWFNRQRDLETAGEEAQLRLESEENLVKIVTVHKSKGLQYGIVFCPFLWDDAPDTSPSNKKGKPFSYHDPENPEKSWLVMDAEDSAVERSYYTEEIYSESLRLLYVALTRAEYHCTIVAGNFKDIHKSALAWLLAGSKLTKSSWGQDSNAIKAFSQQDWQSQLDALVDDSEGTIYLEPLPEPEAPVVFTAGEQTNFKAEPRRFKRHLKKHGKITSYTGITRGHSVEQPDYDRSSQSPEDSATAIAIGEQASGFIRGREAGVCLHWILEHLDFVRPVSEQQKVVEDGLNRQGFSLVGIDQTITWLQNVLFTPLHSEEKFCLADIQKQQRINELEFHYPLAQIDSGKIKSLLRKYFQHPAMLEAISQLDLSVVQGYLKGFIDLIFYHADRYYLVDYKSNWLGETVNDYERSNLTVEIAHSHYYLQYLIYAVALHRYLKIRLKDYQYEIHTGGVYYLFIRGMNPETGAESGIYHDCPPLDLIESLSDLFETGDLK